MTEFWVSGFMVARKPYLIKTLRLMTTNCLIGLIIQCCSLMFRIKMNVYRKTFVVAASFDKSSKLYDVKNSLKIVKTVKVFPFECFAIYGIVWLLIRCEN